MYAEVIIDISHEQIDRPFSYRVPAALEQKIIPGCQVLVPFGRGNSLRKAYVVGLSDTAPLKEDQLKEIDSVTDRSIAVESRLISLAAWIRREYGGTMIQALKVVMPVRERKQAGTLRVLALSDDPEKVRAYMETARRKNWKARLRVLEALTVSGQLPWHTAQKQFGATMTVIRPMLEEGIVTLIPQNTRFSGHGTSSPAPPPVLNEEQQRCVSRILSDYDAGVRTPCLIHGVTGSGKTEVYLHLIEGILARGKSAIVLIPEISLTYQTAERFFGRFGGIVAIVNSRLSQKERYEQFERARSGSVRIMIGPRSALFTPFQDLGLVILDEEHETAYRSEQAPRYHARETAVERARECGALVVLGSATPSMEAYSRAMAGAYRLFTLRNRAVEGSRMAEVSIADLRRELREGNKSIFSRILQEKMDVALSRGEQVMLFLNRRGYSRSVSCRSCGNPVGCPHCAVPLTEHNGGFLICHYCGYTIRMPSACPTCGSSCLSGFGIGTEKAEELARIRFPYAKVLRMDSDTTSGKDGHGKVLEAFARHEADILVGTQMIVKGLDFPDVTVMGVLAADMSLYSGDFRSSERTFQLLAQAAGRAGRGDKEGHVIIQTYAPFHYGIRAAASQDYEAFYEQEIRFRTSFSYPPAGYLCEVVSSSRDRSLADRWIRKIVQLLKQTFSDKIKVIGPSDAPVSKIRDFWRRHIYVLTPDHDCFIGTLSLVSAQEAQMQGSGAYLTVIRN